jgi:hypothetical protein
MTTSAQAAASAGASTWKPALSALAADAEPGRSATTTLRTPLSCRLLACPNP